MKVFATVLMMLLLIMISDAYVLLYNTETNGMWEFKDCIYYDSMNDAPSSYCFKSVNGSMISERYTECENNGDKWYFKDLLANNISPQDILRWSSSVEVADDYAHVFYNRAVGFEANDFLCNCTRDGSFGKFCEYALLGGNTIQSSIRIQFILKYDSLENQRRGSIVCYETLSCEFGLLCLDWRNICDGEQQCMNGLDEENCDKLEFNECEEDEYRCSNGMCIPELYFLDGDWDCMDRSDEMARTVPNCWNIPLPFECDEYVGIREQWSCGDGEYISAWSRLPSQTLIPIKKNCNNLRNLNYMCEMSMGSNAWTLPNGMCEFSRNYDDPRFDMITANLSLTERCVYLLKCALTKGFEYHCPCGRNTSCYNLMTSLCPNPQWIQFPSAGVIRPYLLTYYVAQENYHDKTPTHFVFSGNIKCRGYHAQASITMNITSAMDPLVAYFFLNHYDLYLCSNPLIQRNISSVIKYFHTDCWNSSRTFSNLPYHFIDICSFSKQCISSYRIRDGMVDCPNAQDENLNISGSSCAKIQRHRYQCSPIEQKCLIPRALGDSKVDCTNKYDQYIYGTSELMSRISCKRRDDEGCRFLRTYFEQSSVYQTIEENALVPSIGYIRHRSYCDSHWDIYPPIDEQTKYCQEWLCMNNWFQCKTNQCIYIDWVCDGEWDCSDASDEQGIFMYENVLTINQAIPGIREIIEKCTRKYAIQPFSDICNISREFPCLLANVIDPLDINRNRPCIDLALIGDDVYHCYGGLDERNTAIGCSGTMKGFDFHCGQGLKCFAGLKLCLDRCLNNEDPILCFHKNKTDLCRFESDVVCLDGQCMPNSRCNGISECQHGEDEYWCILHEQASYRFLKHKLDKERSHQIDWPTFPLKEMHTSLTVHEPMLFSEPFNLPTNSLNFAFKCNQGLAVRLGTNIRCMCPGAYYGNRCQYFSDRITIITHLNLSYTPYDSPGSSTVILKIVTFLLFEKDEVIDLHEFHVIPSLERLNYTKHKFYLIYSRSDRMLKHKRQRYFNRTDIINHHPYSVRFVAFELQYNNTIELGVWDYPIYFDFLSSFRLSSILRFPKTYLNQSHDPCINATCNSNSTCRPLFFSQTQSYDCFCKNGFYGHRCHLYSNNCSDYCSTNSICIPNSRPLLLGNKQPLCVCPLNRFGPRCNLKYDGCQSYPCQNNGSCYHTYDPIGERRFVCKCDKVFQGDVCQYENSPIQIEIASFISEKDSLASVIQYYDIHYITFKLIPRHQQVFVGIPSRLRFDHNQIQVPVLGILKLHNNLTTANYYIIYIQPNRTTINLTSTPDRCPHVDSLIPQSKLRIVQ